MVAAGSKFNNLRRGNSGSCSSHNVVINDYSNNSNSCDGEFSRVNRTGCFSSMVDVVDKDSSSVSFTTFNILAPIYKRVDPQVLFCSFLLLLVLIVMSSKVVFLECYIVVFCVFCFEQNQGLRESDFRSFWLARNQRILDSLLSESSSIMCLQVPILSFFIGCDVK